MPELSLVDAQQCVVSSYRIPSDSDSTVRYTVSGLYSERDHPRCTCPAFKYRSGNCKHIERAIENGCGWHSHYGEEQTTPGTCPRCGSETKLVRVAV